jgi:hypothetical protein
MSQLQLLRYLQALLLHPLRPLKLRSRLHPTMFPPPPLVTLVVKAKEDRTSRPSKEMVLTVTVGPLKTSGFPSTLCGKSTNPS